MNTINICGWRVSAGHSSRLLPSGTAALALAMACGALAQTGDFSIIDGPGIGTSLSASIGAVNSPPTVGALQADHAPACPGTFFHYHGVLNGLPDPDPFGCGWGHVAPLAMATPSAPAAMTAPPPRRRLSDARLSADVLPQPFFIPGKAADGIALSQPGAMGALRKEIIPARLAQAGASFAKLDALHALKHSPLPMRRRVSNASRPLSAAPSTGTVRAVRRQTDAALWDFSLTGPGAKLLAPTPKTQP